MWRWNRLVDPIQSSWPSHFSTSSILRPFRTIPTWRLIRSSTISCSMITIWPRDYATTSFHVPCSTTRESQLSTTKRRALNLKDQKNLKNLQNLKMTTCLTERICNMNECKYTRNLLHLLSSFLFIHRVCQFSTFHSRTCRFDVVLPFDGGQLRWAVLYLKPSSSNICWIPCGYGEIIRFDAARDVNVGKDEFLMSTPRSLW